MDATPLTLGQEFSGWVQMLDNGLKHVDQALPSICELALGGTAVSHDVDDHDRVNRGRDGFLRDRNGTCAEPEKGGGAETDHELSRARHVDL